MGLLDWTIFGAFFIALIGIILWVTKSQQNDLSDYFLGGKSAKWIAIGASIFVSNIGSEHLNGLAGAGASSGVAMAYWEIQAWMILILGWVFVPFYTRSIVYTMPEFLERRYKSSSRTILSVILLLSYVLTKIAVNVYSGGLVFKQVFGIESLCGIDFFWIAAIGLVLLTALYAVVGCMKSVLASGTEVSTLVEGAEVIRKDNLKVKIISIPSEGLFRAQGKVFGLSSFGFSAPYMVLDVKLDFTSENVYNYVKNLLK